MSKKENNKLNEDLASHVREFAASYQKNMELMQRAAEAAVKAATEQPTRSSEWMTGFAKAITSLNQFFEEAPDTFVDLAQHGWFTDLESTPAFVRNLTSILEKSGQEELDNHLVDWYRGNLDEIFMLLKRRQSNRTAILDEIRMAIDHEMYFTAIPTILAQVDGVCVDATNGKMKFFIKVKNDKEERLPQFLDYFDEMEDYTSMDLFLSPFRKKIAINLWEKEKKKLPCNLNRHKVLHGSSTDYGTEVNAMKSLSLLKCISDLFYYSKFDIGRDKKK